MNIAINKISLMLKQAKENIIKSGEIQMPEIKPDLTEDLPKDKLKFIITTRDLIL